MHLLCLISTLLSPVSWQLDCLTLSSPPRHFLLAHHYLYPIFFIHQLHCRIVCSHFQCSLLYSVGTVHLHSFALSCLPAFSPFQSLFLYLKHPLLWLCISFHSFRCLFTHLPPFFVLFSLLFIVMDLYVLAKKVLHQMPFLPQPFPFIWAWDQHQETQEDAPDGWLLKEKWTS